jgi:hypothetical protein
MDHSTENNPNDLVTISPAIPGSWTHSREEDVDDVEVYRRFFDFPPSPVPRDGFETLRDGTFVQDELDPAGLIVQVRGRWRQPAIEKLTVSFDDGVHAGFTLQALELSQDLDLLRVRRLPEPSVPPPTSTPEADRDTYA